MTTTAPTRSLRDRLARSALELEDAPATEIVRWAVDATDGALAVACSM
jgi:hypothetical protein